MRAQLSCSNDIRLFRGRKVAQDDEIIVSGSEYVLLELLPVAAPPLSSGAKAVTLDDIAVATGGPLSSAARAEPLPPPEEVHNRIRGFMNSLFRGPDDQEDEDGAEPNNAQEEPANNDEVPPLGPYPGPRPPVDAMAVDEGALQMLVGMGFSANAARKALLLCHGATERAMDWILEHAGDPTLDEPVTDAELAAARRQQLQHQQQQQQQRQRGGAGRQRAAFLPDQDVAARLVDMGFPAEQVKTEKRRKKFFKTKICFCVGGGGAACDAQRRERGSGVSAGRGSARSRRRGGAGAGRRRRRRGNERAGQPDAARLADTSRDPGRSSLYRVFASLSSLIVLSIGGTAQSARAGRFSADHGRSGRRPRPARRSRGAHTVLCLLLSFSFFLFQVGPVLLQVNRILQLGQDPPDEQADN